MIVYLILLSHSNQPQISYPSNSVDAFPGILLATQEAFVSVCVHRKRERERERERERGGGALMYNPDIISTSF